MKRALVLLAALFLCVGLVSVAHADTCPLTPATPLILANGEPFNVQTLDPAMVLTVTPRGGTVNGLATLQYDSVGGTLTLTMGTSGTLNAVANVYNVTVTINGMNTASYTYSPGATVIVVWTYHYAVPHPSPSDIFSDMQDSLNNGDLIAFFTAPLVATFGAFTYFIFLIAISGAFYIRYRNLNIILFLFILFGGAGGLVAVAVPGIAQLALWVLLAIGLAGLLFRVFR